MTNEFLLQDRIQKIQQIIRKYGEENFYISFSGGGKTRPFCLLSLIWLSPITRYRAYMPIQALN